MVVIVATTTTIPSAGTSASGVLGSTVTAPPGLVNGLVVLGGLELAALYGIGLLGELLSDGFLCGELFPALCDPGRDLLGGFWAGQLGHRNEGRFLVRKVFFVTRTAIVVGRVRIIVAVVVVPLIAVMTTSATVITVVTTAVVVIIVAVTTSATSSALSVPSV